VGSVMGAGKALPHGAVRMAFPLFPADLQGSYMGSPYGVVYTPVVSHSPASRETCFVPRVVWESHVGAVNSENR
jgi:hypothetical protein